MKIKTIILVSILFVIILICGSLFYVFNNRETISEDYIEITDKINEIQSTNSIDKSQFMELWDSDILGTIEIPSINLKLSIAEGTEDDIISKYVGHFPSTALINGNVGLAGHNTSEFFSNLKKVQKGDEIIYNFLLGKRTYIVDTIVEIQDDDWSYLEDTEDNKITLITCIRNEPTKRLCVQATEKIE